MFVSGWDLEYNKVIRHYHGHLSGVFCISVHPVLDVLVTGGRDSVARVWDMRTKHQIHVLGGHTNAVSSLITSGADPQVITGSHDTTIKLWDLAAGKCMSTLTQHKKAIRSLTANPRVSGERPLRCSQFASLTRVTTMCFNSKIGIHVLIWRL